VDERQVAGRAGKHPVRYRIVVRGELPTELSSTFQRLSLRHEGRGCTALFGEVVDQTDLVGLIRWLAEAGLEIVSVAPAPRTGTPA